MEIRKLLDLQTKQERRIMAFKEQLKDFHEWLKKKNVELVHTPSLLRLTEKGLKEFIEDYLEEKKNE